MKKFLMILSVALLSGTAIAQQNADAQLKSAAVSDQQVLKAKVATEQKFTAAKLTGNFDFQLPATATAESVNKAAGYYTKFFTVTFNDKTKNAHIKMVQDDAQGRHVIVRFLVANNVRMVTMDGKDYDLDEFWNKYMN